MTSTHYRSSRPDPWTMPRPHTDPSQRFMKHGPLRPMDEDRGLIRRLFSW